MKKRLVAGNWKMYVETAKEAKELATVLRRKLRSFSGVDVYIAPPFPLLPIVAQVLDSSPIKVGAQSVSSHDGGAHTGETSAKMLKSSGASFSIVGHSERRAAGETDEDVHAQALAALAAGLKVIVCVGEEEREEGGEHFAVIERQLTRALKDIPASNAGKLVIAYEPVWAIGKSAAEAMQSADLEEMVIFIRKILSDITDRASALKVAILYGGSVDGSNASELLQSGVSGFLVGRASANRESFLEILNACKK